MKERRNQSPARQEKTEANMRRAAALLSDMLAHTVAETRRLQKQQEKALGRRYEDRTELNQDYRPGEMKDLTALLTDIAAVTKALDERGTGQEKESQGGVVLLPPVALPQREEGQPDGAESH